MENQMTATEAKDVGQSSDRDVRDQRIVGSRVFVAVRSSDIAGCVETRVFPSFDVAILWCYCTHRLHRPEWSPFLTRNDPTGPMQITEAGKTKRVRYVGWQQQMKDGSMMQIFEETVRGDTGY
jgi:hypothetical protein